MMTYRTNNVAEKPVSSFSSTTSLGPLQSQLGNGPGHKIQMQAYAKKSKTILGSLDNTLPTTAPLVRSANTTKNSVIPAMVSKLSSETPIIKPLKIEGSAEQLNSTEEESKTARTVPSVLSASEEDKSNEPVSEVFKQRLTQHRRQISKQMIFSD